MTVFANGMEISAKAQGCKVIAAFPDVCFTPPQTPATPPGVPIPYPNFGFDSDLTSGSSTVKIGGKPISLENKSHYSKCSGDEAGCAPKKGVVTSKNTGKVYAQAWSMDVKVEGKGVARFGDIATSNHGSNTGDTPPMVIAGTPAAAVPSRRHGADQTCEDDELTTLQGEKDAIVAELGSHRLLPGQKGFPANEKKWPSVPCSEVRKRIQIIERLQAKRQEIQDKCFGGKPDAVHQRAIDELNNALANLRELLKHCAG
jgi:uncharacterized Zn-binding protein involved in type VI secretion